MVPSGPQGTAKSTLQEMFKRIIDPGSVLTITAHTDLPQIIQALAHSYLTIFDNVSEIKDVLSDLLCRVITGTGFLKRILYSNDALFAYKMIRAVGFNGINVTATRADLLERILKIELEPINKNDREKLARINKTFEGLLPHLLGFIFDTISKVLDRLGEVDLRGEFPRMADWAELGELIARVLGYDEMEFINAYRNNLGLTSSEAVEANPVAVASINFMEDRPTWRGPASELLDRLNAQENSKGHSNILRSAAWPKHPNKLSAKLAEIVPNLKEVGIIFSREFDKHNNRYEITLVNQLWKPSSDSKSSNEKAEDGDKDKDKAKEGGLFGRGKEDGKGEEEESK
jgi:hypothetical protein